MRLFLMVCILSLIMVLSSCGRGQSENTYEIAIESEAYEEIATPSIPEPNEPHIPAPPTPTPIQEIPAMPPVVGRFDFSEDAYLLVSTIEDAHPSFIMYDWSLDNYFTQREIFLSSVTSTLLSVDEFKWAIRRYVTSLRDSHMNLHSPNDTFLDVNIIFYDGNLYVTYDDAVKSKLIAIGGVYVTQIIQNIEMYFYLENDTARYVGYPFIIRRKSLLMRSGAEISDGSTQVTLLYGEDKNIVYKNKSFAPLVPHRFNWGNNYVTDYHMINDIFYIRASRFTCGRSHLEVFDGDYGIERILTLCWRHQRLHNSISAAVDNGIRYFIVDVRDNIGGNTIIPEMMLNRLGIYTPFHGGYRRTSWLTRAALPDLNHVDYAVALPCLERAANPKNIVLVVLMNHNTNSAANLFASLIQDGSLGYLIGEPSVQSPSMFGDMLSVYLPKSSFYIPISHLRVNRADANADQLTLWPDIIVPYSEALYVALEFIYNRG